MMKEKMIAWAIGMIVERMAAEDVKKWVDIGLDILESAIEKSETKYDDMVVLPIIKIIREAFDIPDDDEE